MNLPSPTTSKKKPPYRAMTAAELFALPAKEWTIPGMLPASGLGVIYGPSHVGKSFVTLNLMMAIAEGQPWFGRKTKARSVLYLALEGTDGIIPRLRAWTTQHGRPIPEAAKFLRESELREAEFHLDNDEDIECLAETVESLELGDSPVIFIDTLSAAMLGMDENSSAEMGAAIRRIRWLINQTGAMVIFVAHSGKDVTKGLRGSSKLPADCDTIFQVRKTDAKRLIRVEKQRDGRSGEEWCFELLVVPYGEDDEGLALDSCVVRAAGGERATASENAVKAQKPGAQRRLGSNEKLVVAAMTSLAQNRGDQPGAGSMFLEAELFGAFQDLFQGSPKHVRSRWSEALTSLAKDRQIVRASGAITLIKAVV